jgi:hypothetical protein
MGSAHAGIYAEGGGTVIVDNCRIMNIAGPGVSFGQAGSLTVENSRIESFAGSGSGIFVNANAAESVVVKNTVIDASPLSGDSSGFVVNGGTGSVQASLQNVTIMGAGIISVWTQNGVTEVTGSQGRRILISEYLHHVFIVPSCFEAFSFDPELAGFVLFE